MKKIIYSILYFLLISEVGYANGGILGDFKGNSEDTKKALREGDIHTDDIPVMIKSAIDTLMQIAGTISIIFIIIGSYKILFGSLQQDKTKGKDTIIMALGGFIIASFSWFIIRLIIDNFS